jgi:hypothetical protein
MNREERRVYEDLVIESLIKRKKDLTDLINDAYIGWRAFNSRKKLNNPLRSLKLIRHEMSTEIIPSMYHREIITLEEGFYGLSDKVSL